MCRYIVVVSGGNEKPINAKRKGKKQTSVGGECSPSRAEPLRGGSNLLYDDSATASTSMRVQAGVRRVLPGSESRGRSGQMTGRGVAWVGGSEESDVPPQHAPLAPEGREENAVNVVEIIVRYMPRSKQASKPTCLDVELISASHAVRPIPRAWSMSN